MGDPGTPLSTYYTCLVTAWNSEKKKAVAGHWEFLQCELSMMHGNDTINKDWVVAGDDHSGYSIKPCIQMVHSTFYSHAF